jgi:hypothetical protein
MGASYLRRRRARWRYGQRVLDPVTRRRIAAVLLVAGIVLAVLAIGNVGPFSDPPTEEERAEATVVSFFGAASDGDFKTFCDLLTKDARRGIEARAAGISAEGGPKGCKEILTLLAKKQFAGSEALVTDVSISGPRARAEVNLKLEGERGHEQRTVLLEQIDGEWLVSDPGFG